MLLFIRIAGIILPIYVMLKALTALQRHRLRQVSSGHIVRPLASFLYLR
ncbi:hypothetical protein OIU77_014203 [Salix suchowensis]|uniref:Uncharacterized protein n=1 Tax=Salix suchowensis TaxID=1278906 RepID=A0ABQ8ZXB5_9ROSI|nr:hypothetical protein OIU77_014203 [Salix suchowensis]